MNIRRIDGYIGAGYLNNTRTLDPHMAVIFSRNRTQMSRFIFMLVLYV